MTDDNAKAEFERIFGSFGKEILRYANLKVADRSVAEDIAASTFLRYWEKHAGGEKILNPRAFLYFIAHGLVVDHYRKSNRRVILSLEFVDEVLTTVEPDIDSLDTRQRYVRVIEKLRALKDGYREVILLHYVEGLTIAEVAEVLQESENNIRVRLHRALAKLRAQFDHE